MASAPQILVLVEDGSRPDQLVKSFPASRGRLRVLPWDKVTGADLARRELGAVVFQAGSGLGERRRRDELLRRLPEGVARISLLPPRRRRGAVPRTAPADLHLTAPLDLRVLDRILSLRRRCRELEELSRRSRRIAGQVSRHLKTLGEVTRLSHAEFQPRAIAETALEKIARLCPVTGWAVFLVDEEKSCLTFESCRGRGMATLVGSRLGMGEGAAGRVLRSREPFLISRAAAANPAGAFPELPAALDWAQILALPLLSRGKAIGVVELIRESEAKPFRRRDQRILSLLLEPMAIAIDNAILLRRSEELSVTDDLTKLYNSRYLNACLMREVQRARRYEGQVSLIFLDLDGFKNVNDQHGHLAGSRALVEVGAVIRNMVREIDVVSRFGGDEFTVILPQTGPEGARVIAERIRARVAETVFLEAFGLKVRITASFGIASFPDHAQSKDALIQKADQAMYRVKGRGKNGVELAD